MNRYQQLKETQEMELYGDYSPCKFFRAKKLKGRFYLSAQCGNGKKIKILGETEKAYKIKNAGYDVETGKDKQWLPKSVIRMIDDQMWVAGWFVKKYHVPCFDRYFIEK